MTPERTPSMEAEPLSTWKVRVLVPDEVRRIAFWKSTVLSALAAPRMSVHVFEDMKPVVTPHCSVVPLPPRLTVALAP